MIGKNDNTPTSLIDDVKEKIIKNRSKILESAKKIEAGLNAREVHRNIIANKKS